jgi:hypothetical protein
MGHRFHVGAWTVLGLALCCGHPLAAQQELPYGPPTLTAPADDNSVPSFWQPTLLGPGSTPPLPAPSIPADISVIEAEPPAPALPDYQWYDPRNVFSPVFWGGNIQFGLNGNTGNSDTLSFRTGLELSRETDRTNWDIDLTYARTEQDGVATQDFAILWSNWDFKLANPKWSWFIKYGITYDAFKNYDLQLFASTGLGYLLIDTPHTQFRPRFGAGVSREFGGDNEDVIAEAVFGFDYAYKFNQTNKLAIVYDYYPDWEDFSNFRQITDAGWEILLSEDAGLSLKLGIIQLYDSTPEDAEKSAINYSVLLLWAL